jgi:8-oxo-dGTP pyrophosphatase MutT (NUDIX family)
VVATKPLRPRDAATLIIIDRSGPHPLILMGKRRMEQVFMPGKYVFPGGRVDKTDRMVPVADDLSPADTAKLLLAMKGGVSRSRARALAIAAIRETFEEAGIVIGARPAATPATAARAPAGWGEFLAHGYLPNLQPLTFFARAITPPGRPRRYDTRFFYMDATAITHRTETTDGELSGLHWLSFTDARDLDLPSITRVVLEDLAAGLQRGDLQTPGVHIPFYHFRNGSFRRDHLAVDASEP